MKNHLFWILLLAIVACKEAPKEQDVVQSKTADTEVMIENHQGNFAHSVYIWLHNPTKTEDRMAFESSLTRFINKSGNIQTKHLGVPADTDREVIDNSYTYSLLLTFEDKAAQDRYQEEPAHKQFIEESSKLWKKILVYDSENILRD